jgi:hypothetical protein
MHKKPTASHAERKSEILKLQLDWATLIKCRSLPVANMDIRLHSFTFIPTAVLA